MLKFTYDGWYISCPGTNGMFINGVRIQGQSEWKAISVNDELRIVNDVFVRID